MATRTKPAAAVSARRETRRETVAITLTVPLEVTEPRSFPSFYEEAATVKAADGEYTIGRCIAGTALYIFRPNGKPRLVVPMSALLRGIMDEVFRLQAQGDL